MKTSNQDERSKQRRALDEQIAAEPPLPIPELPPDLRAQPVEAFLTRRRHPIAVAGVVENGVVRPVDSSIKLQEHARVIIVAAEAG